MDPRGRTCTSGIADPPRADRQRGPPKAAPRSEARVGRFIRMTDQSRDVIIERSRRSTTPNRRSELPGAISRLAAAGRKSDQPRRKRPEGLRLTILPAAGMAPLTSPEGAGLAALLSGGENAAFAKLRIDYELPGRKDAAEQWVGSVHRTPQTAFAARIEFVHPTRCRRRHSTTTRRRTGAVAGEEARRWSSTGTSPSGTANN
jgi:hypothetical protein